MSLLDSKQLKLFNRVAEKWEEIDFELINELNKIK